MVKKKTEPFDESCKFIIKNLDITTDQLPDNLLDYWSVKDENDTQAQFDIFMFAYTLFIARKQGHGKVILNIDLLDNLFESFQAIITLEKLSRKMPINCEKKKIFDFDSYDGKLELGIDKNNITIVENIIKVSLGKYQ